MVAPRWARRFASAQDGNAAIMFAAVTMVFLVCSAFAVDEGSLYLTRRRVQSAVDLAAIAAARDPENGEAIAATALASAGLMQASAGAPVPELTVVPGAYRADAGLPVADRFQPGAASPNAVRVTYRRTGQLFFARIWMQSPTIGVTAVAAAEPRTAFSIGSTLARFHGGIANAVLGQLIGTNVSLSALSYQSMLDAHVSVFHFLDGLAGQLHITAGTYDDVLAASASRGAIVRAIASSLDGADRIAAQTLAAGMSDAAPVSIGRLFDLGGLGRLAIGSGGGAADSAAVSVRDLLVASAALGDGAHQAAVDLDAGVPQITGLAATLAIGEPAQNSSWFAIGGDGAVTRTAQVRLKLVLTLAGGPALDGAAVRLPLYLELADSEASVTSAACPAAGEATGSATIAVRPGIARLQLGEVADTALADFARAPNLTPARLVNLALLRVTGSADAEIRQTSPIALQFSAEDIAAGVVHTAATTTPTQSLSASLLQSLRLEVTALAIGLPAGPTLRAALRTLLAPLAPLIDTTIDTVLAGVGMSVGAADIRVYGVDCQRSVLVQ